MDIKEILEKRFTEEELSKVKGSFDIIGDVAILEVPEELRDKYMDIVEALLEIHPRIKTVYRKVDKREGQYRLRELELLYGDEKETEHKEFGYRIRLDVRKVYFSPREANERQRIASQVKPNEVVMVMFAGAGPYAIAIAKKQPKVKKIYAIELNPDAYKYMVENIRINKVGDKIVPILGDVEIESEKFFGKCDRVVMPLPKGAYEFLKPAVRCLKDKGGIIHYYFWSAEEAIEDVKELVKDDVEICGRKVKDIKVKKVSEYAPKTYKFCMDIKVE
ncbi:MAG: class I SAM-dependent methyltransferase family protein [Candidatus Aenigmatarchaeota archaeon]